MGWIAEHPPSAEELGQLASSSFFRALIRLVARQGAHFWFGLDVVLFLVLGACFTRISWRRATTTDVRLNETQMLALKGSHFSLRKFAGCSASDARCQTLLHVVAAWLPKRCCLAS